MGRNSGSKLFFTVVAQEATDYHIIWYCQQHAKWAVKQHSSIGAADSELGDHFNLDHGLT